MNGNSVLLDTNTVLYFLGGDQTLSDFISDKKVYISVITELELLGYKKLISKELNLVTRFIQAIQVIPITEEIKETTVKIRRSSSIKLPDCIIAATSIAMNLPLITADKGMKKIPGLDMILYENNHTE